MIIRIIIIIRRIRIEVKYINNSEILIKREPLVHITELGALYRKTRKQHLDMDSTGEETTTTG